VQLTLDSNYAYSFALKVPTLDCWNSINTKLSAEEYQHNVLMIRQMQNTECNAYKIVSKVPGFPAPKIWHAMEADKEQTGKRTK
jgi:hypothetical protein